LKSAETTLAVRPGEGIPVSVVVTGAADATDIRVIQSGVVEDRRKFAPGSDGIQLCANATGDCTEVKTIPRSSSTMIWVRPKGHVEDAGHFKGTVTIASSVRREGDGVNVDFYVTSWWLQVLGGVAILAGVALAWIVSVWAKGRSNRLQLLMPAAFLRERLRTVKAMLGAAPPAIAPPAVSNTAGHLEEWLAKLDPKRLEGAGYLPPDFPLAFAKGAPNADKYGPFLETAAKWVEALRQVVEDGMAVAWKQLPSNSVPASVTAVVDAIKALDALVAVPEASDLGDLPVKIVAIKTDLETKLRPIAAHAAPLGAPALVGKGPGPQSYDRIMVQLRDMSLLAWIATAAITTLLGVYILVAQNLGFGIWPDFVECVLWGIGLPSAASLLQQTPQQVGTVLGVTVNS
jgi:hypothetical protein